MDTHLLGGRKLRIVHFVTSLRVGGLERFALELARAQMNAGHQVALVALREGPLLGPALEAGLPVRVLGPWKYLRLARMVCHAAKFIPDVIHAHNPMPLHYGALAKLLSGARLVMTDHGQGSGIVRVPSWLEYRLTDAAVAVSERTARRNGLHRFRSTAVIRNGITDRRPQKEAAEVRALLALPNNPIGICVASLTPVKAHEVLIRAVAELRDRHVPVTILLAGDGPRRVELERLTAELGLDERWIRFLGVRLDILDLLHAADFKVLCSRMEGLPLSILEAMQQGKPVVASAVGGIPEVVRHEESGLLVPPEQPTALADAIARLCGDEELRFRLGVRGRAIVTRDFTFAEMNRRYEQLYRTVLTRSRKLPNAPSDPPSCVNASNAMTGISALLPFL